MKYFQQALDADMAEDYNSAICFYRLCLSNGEEDIDVFVNLAFIYLSTIEVGWADYFKIQNEYQIDLSNNVTSVLQAAQRIYPDCVEPFFLEKYMYSRIVYCDFSPDEVLQIMQAHVIQSLVPYFYLYLFEPEKYKPQQQMLVYECAGTPTAKNKYILSLIA